jgi:hypothetical protein
MQNNFIFKNALFSCWISIISAFIFFYLRLNLENPPFLVVNIFLILFVSFFSPYFFLKKIIQKNENLIKCLYPLICIFLLFLVTFELSSFFQNQIIFVYYILFIYCIYKIILYFFYIKKKIDIKYVVKYFLLVVFISIYYFVTISNSNITTVFSPEQGLLGLLNHDTRFHAAISHNIQNFREISLGLDGYAPITYHYFYHLFIAAIGAISESEPLWTMSAVQYILLVPSFFFFVNYAAAAANNYKENFLYYASFSFFLLILSEVIFTYEYSYFASVTLSLSLMCVLASVPTLLIFSHLKKNIIKFIVATFLIIFSVIIFANKVSSGVLYLIFISWIFFRNYNLRKELLLLAILTLFTFYLNFFLFSPKPSDYTAYEGNLFAFFFILNFYGQISIFSPYLFVAIYLMTINFSLKLKSKSKLYFPEGLLVITLVSLFFVVMGIPKDSGAVSFMYLPMIISIPMIVSKISLAELRNLVQDKNKKIKNLKKILTISVLFVFLFISIDRAINVAPQKEIIKKMVYANNKLSNNKILNNDISEADYIRNSIKKNYTIFDKQFQEHLALNFFSQIRSLKSTLELNPHIGFFVPPDNSLIWNFSEQHMSKLILCNNSLHIVPSLVGYATIFGAHPLKFDCPKEAYISNYLSNNNSSNVTKINLCQRAKKINLKTIYILNEKNNKLKKKIIDCDY